MELFRFVAIRAPDPAPVGTGIPLADPLDAAGPSGGDPIRALRSLLRQGNAFTDPDDVPDAANLSGLAAALADPADSRAPADIVAAVFDSPASDVVRAPWDDRRAQVDYGLLIGKWLRPPQGPQLGELARLRRAMTVVEAVAANDATTRDEAESLMTAPLLLPPSLAALGSGGEGGDPAPADESADDGTSNRGPNVDELREKVHSLGHAVDELLSVSPGDLVIPERPAASAVGIGAGGEPASTGNGAYGYGWRDALWSLLGGVRPRPRTPTPISTRSERYLLVKPSAVSQLSPTTRAVLADQGIDPARTPLETVTARLQRARREMTGTLHARSAELSTRVTMVRARTMLLGTVHPVGLTARPATAAPPAPDSVPPSLITPSGVGQLLVVRQQLLGYEGGEVSHIENVLKGETKGRDHTRRVTTEEVFVTERERETAEERDLQATERFEIGTEATDVLEERKSGEGQVTVSSKYGPSVEVDASAGAAVSSSRERSRTVASEFAREIVDKAVTRVTERVREQHTRRLVQEVEEINRHAVDNTGGDGDHVVGVYQWLDKVYEAQVFDYGLRTFYDLLVPEPAALYLAAFQRNAATPTIAPPPEFTIGPADVDEGAYAGLVATYGATGVAPPPEEFRTVGDTLVAAREEKVDGSRLVEETQIPIPDGWEAVSAWITWDFSGTLPYGWLTTVVGNVLQPFVAPSQYSGTTSIPIDPPVTGSLPAAIFAAHCSGYTVSVEVKCRRTIRAMDAWRIQTYEALAQAHEKSRSAYDHVYKRQAEMKRAAITLLANANPDFDAIDDAPPQPPLVDITAARASGPLIQFLEQAFEWEHMSYLHYPYFWGRREHWTERITLEDQDPDFATFLTSGAARVSVPVRLGFEDAVDHFSHTRIPWLDGDLPTMTDDLYVPFVEEHKQQLGAPDNEVPFGAPWRIQVPTSLVLLRPDRTLPKWQKTNGDWSEVDPPPGVGI